MTVESIEAEVATSEPAESSVPPEEGNLTMAEYASNLLKAQSEEEQPESPEEETEPSDLAALPVSICPSFPWTSLNL